MAHCASGQIHDDDELGGGYFKWPQELIARQFRIEHRQQLGSRPADEVPQSAAGLVVLKTVYIRQFRPALSRPFQ